jgi:putative DNA primase/helicase
LAAHQARVDAARRARNAEEAARRLEGLQKARALWYAAGAAPADHPYLVRKGVKPYGLRIDCRGRLLVPIPADGPSQICGLQSIDRDGDKRYLPGSVIVGHYFIIGDKTVDGPLFVCEGYATGATVHEATRSTVAIAFDCGNLLAVARALRERYPDRGIVLCADNDIEKPDNPGLTKAREAAAAVGGEVATPDFGENRPEDATDFNDMHRLQGLEAVAECIRRQVESGGDHATSDAEDLDVTVRRLAELSPIEYDRVRQVEADALGVRVATLDLEVEKLRRTLNAGGAQQGSEGSGEAVLFPELEPWTEPVDGAELLKDVAVTCRRYVVLPKHADTAIALWVVFTHAIGSGGYRADSGAHVAPEKRCGKSTVLALLGRLVPRSLPAVNISGPCLFRAVEAWSPTLLIDEADSFLRNSEELRGILNSGHTRDLAFVIRNVAVGDDYEPRRFKTWGAKAIALIGKLPDTLADRSIEISLKRKLPGEPTERLRHARSSNVLQPGVPLRSLDGGPR